MHLLVRFLACSTRLERLRAVAYLLHAAVERSIKAGEGEAAANFLQLAAPALEAQSRWLVPRPGHLATSWFVLRERAGLLAQRIGFLRAHPL
jgi:hypothetical protein